MAAHAEHASGSAHDAAHGHGHGHGHDNGHGDGGHTHHGNYVRIYGILLVLLVVSIVGPELGIRWVTLITAFGVAGWKAYLVAKHFMHINFAPSFVGYLVATSLLFMLLFFAGTAPDVMQAEGRRWAKPDWVEAQAAARAGDSEADAAEGAAHTH